ncbi:MAG: hypothetical protein IKF83_01025 [Clostridia bacterium]|nr:hypothetical protein [Clostridia bacterium]
MEELDLKQLFQLFWEKKITIILVVLFFAVIGTIYTLGFVTPKYKASTTLVLTKTDSNTATPEQQQAAAADSITATDITINSKLVATYSELIKSKAIIREVLSNTGLNDLSEDTVRNNVTVSALKDTEVIQITVSNKDATYAAKIANGIAEVFTKKVAEIYNINNVHVVDKAEIPEGPYNIDHKKDIAIFAIIGLVVSIGFILVANMLDTTVKTTDDIEKNIEVPVLASISMYDYDGEKGGKRK